MYKTEFLNDKLVKSFIQWLEEKLDKPGTFNHTYKMKKPSFVWTCNSIYSAFENYKWSFSATDPISKSKVTGSTFDESANFLSKLSSGLRQSIEKSDYKSCITYCFSILEWGGVRTNNDKKLLSLGDNLCQYLTYVRGLLNPDKCCTNSYNDLLIMNSGFTKIYSLFIDDYIIYDGRVGAALGLMVRMYCEDNKLNVVPKELAFAWGRGKESVYKNSLENKRNPSKNNYVFQELLNNPKRHTENNIRANWLLKEVLSSTNSKFNMLDKTIQLRALEAALFMIGYDVTM